MKKTSRTTIILPMITAVAFVTGMFCSGLLHSGKGLSDEEKKFRNILNIIENEYVDNVDIDSLIEAALPALFNKLDPHSLYIPASDLQGLNEDLDGSFCGIGVHFSIFNDTITVVEALTDGPAEKVGIKGGDRIIAVDGQNVAGTGISNDEVMKKLRGARNTEVVLTVKRKGLKNPIDITVTRGDIPVTSVDAAYMLTDSIGYISVNKFARSTYDEFWQSLWDLKDLGATDYIIDLRGNTGGFMEQAILMVNEFLQAQTPIVYTVGRRPSDSTFVGSDGTGSFQESKIIVLLDEISASASEIFAGAVQDNDRGLIIGRRSFGKGLVQRQIELPDSSALRLTIARYYTPTGRSIQKDYSNPEEYENEIYERYYNGEAFEADSIHNKSDQVFVTPAGRTVYGGGGITPDIFIPVDTIGVSNYFRKVSNAGLFNSFALEYVDLNRTQLEEAHDVPELLRMLPPDYTLLRSFTAFAARNGIPAQWSGINYSASLIVNRLKAFIARDILGIGASMEITNEIDPIVNSAVEALQSSQSDFPIKNPRQ